MDPRIAWYPRELIGNAYSTWANVWMMTQMNRNINNNINSNNSNNNNNNINSNNASFLSNCNCCSTNNLKENINFNAGVKVCSKTIENGVDLRMFNKASTFGFNFPINQHALEDPYSTPWLYYNRIENNQIQRDTLLYKTNKIEQHHQHHHQQQQLEQQLGNDKTNFYSPTMTISRNRFKTISSSSSSSSLSNSPPPQPPPINTMNNNSCTNLNNIINYDSNNQNHFFNFNNNYHSEGLINLHKEIISFSNYISPTPQELYMRNDIIYRISKVIKEEFPHAQVDIFGSYKTGLFLPTSDIDMVVFGEWKNLPLKVLKDALIKEKISNQDNIKVLDKASVPIIKILETKTDLKVDISFNTVNGVKSAELIKKYLVEFPCLRPLVMVLKQFLIQRDLNEVWTGGIGSYSLILMTVSFLQLHTRIDTRSTNANLGVLLIEFFELYGRHFNYMKTAIRIKNGGCYLPKEEMLKQFDTAGYRSSILCIEDPLNPLNDIGKGSYGALKVKQAFEYAYFALSYAVLPQNEFLLKKTQQSILGRIVRITREVRDYRELIRQSYERLAFEMASKLINEKIYQTSNLNNKQTEANINELNQRKLKNKNLVLNRKMKNLKKIEHQKSSVI